ncbi:hypothetical protein [Iningainema tapete]|uniref:Uncharacterized protein n=1 Tax=Iningainema tapete BLCC-T55 TaxID=2748662 RepID=A0A8J6XER1_9CYAN|nr:hypothetical protein [Iningainema tapete]MBD2771101.1 hypothetical protein [Iningainema tapete BLCC-T55]
MATFTTKNSQFNKADTVDGILLEKVTHVELENLDLEKSGHRSLVVRQTQNIKVQYVAMKIDI